MKISILLLALFLISTVSAGGLGIVGENSFNIEKTEGVDTSFQVTVQNQDAFTFHNIIIEGEGIATMSKIDKLDSGQSTNVTIRLSGDDEFNGKIKITGEYEASLGASNITEVIQVTYDNGIDKCDLSLIKGDSVTWKNNGLDEIRLKDVDTGEYFLTIEESENGTRLFTEPITLEYVAVWIVPFTTICTIEVANDEGLIHSAEYDAEINLNLSMTYKETSIETTFLSTSYSLDYNQVKTKEYFSIKNTGSQTARYKISSEWITFEENNFNLEAGDSRNIEYSISPIVMQTNQTNKTYIKTITIEGNFEKLEKDISIYVKYANLDDIIGDEGLTEEWFNNMVDLGCIAYPENSRCKRQISFYNSSSGSTIELNEESFRLFLEKYGEDLIKEDKERKADAEYKANLSKTMEKLESGLDSVKNETGKTNETSENASKTSLFLLILISSTIILVVAIILIMKEKKKRKVKTDLGITEEEAND